MTEVQGITNCAWVGDGEGCKHLSLIGKSYCNAHNNRVYSKYLTEMADYVINKELDENDKVVKFK